MDDLTIQLWRQQRQARMDELVYVFQSCRTTRLLSEKKD